MNHAKMNDERPSKSLRSTCCVSETTNGIVLVAFVSQLCIVFVVKTCLIVLGMPYERQLKVRQVYKTLSLGVELIKSDAKLI